MKRTGRARAARDFVVAFPGVLYWCGSNPQSGLRQPDAHELALVQHGPLRAHFKLLPSTRAQRRAGPATSGAKPSARSQPRVRDRTPRHEKRGVRVFRPARPSRDALLLCPRPKSRCRARWPRACQAGYGNRPHKTRALAFAGQVATPHPAVRPAPPDPAPPDRREAPAPIAALGGGGQRFHLARSRSDESADAYPCRACSGASCSLL